MATKKPETEERFVKNNHIDDIYTRAKEIDPDIWLTLQRIKEHYSEYSKHCEAITQKTALDFLGKNQDKSIHSIRFRIKDINSLCVKIVKKKAYLSKDIQEDYEIEKYRSLNDENYYKIITDISGIRILIRYREQWQHVHKLIWDKFYQGDEWYLKDFVKDYKTNIGKSFIAEKPKVYYRNQHDRKFYESIGKDIFEFHQSDEGYNSLHYIINIDGKYIELQVRTILDEAWSECTHDIVYKAKNKSQLEELKYLSQCLSQQTIAAETITNLMYEKVNKNGMIFSKKKSLSKQKTTTKKPEIRTSTRNSIEKRVKQLDSQITQGFDGNLDALL